MRLMFAVLIALVPSLCLAKAPAPNTNGPTVNLPQSMQDSSGNNWMVYQQGWFQMQGNNPIYGQSAQLMINNNQPNNRGGGGNRAHIDEKTGELIFEFNNQGLNITRRVLMDKKDGYIRYIEIVKNSRPNEQTVNLQITSNLNFGVNTAEIVPDPHKHDHNLAWIAASDGPSCAVEIYASKNAKVTPSIDWQPGNNTVTAVYPLTVPAGKSAAILHLHMLSSTSDAGVKYVESMKEAKVIADVPLEIRKMLVNFVSTNGMAGDFEVLRGDILDVVELRGGDQYKGTLQEPTFKLDTFYGKIELPAERVVGLINVGDFHPRQLIITSEGEIFGGHLATDSLHLQLSSGQVTSIPLSQVSRMGFRKRPGEPEEWTLTKPMVLLRTGDRVQIDLPTQPISVATRYGKLTLDPKTVSSLILAAEDSGVHEIILADGSKFAGLVDGDSFDMILIGGKEEVKFPANAVARIQFSPPNDPDADAPTMDLVNGDKLVGQLTGEFKLDTSFDTLTINGAEVKRLAHPDPAGLDVQITLWDDSTCSGQLEQPDVPMKLNSGVTLTIPAALIAEYTQPEPTPSPAMIARITALVTSLGAEDYKQREQAETDLTAMGPSVARILRDLKPTQSPEAQQRIDTVLKGLEKKSSAASH
ncbi:MAG TPA: hypothetical protein VFE58_06595 [Tepidisphaeraceae bacterium]|jgi:hypothetical protein|nr:hypothetical protein [Tepidisphaeraceae bacterium]